MYITQETDYALRIVYCMASAKKRIDARTISEEMNVPLRFSLKILGKLSQCELVKSFKGNKGGYELQKKPNEITLLSVIECLEGRYRISRCTEKDAICSRGANGYCSFQKVFIEITQDINEKLSKITFQDLLEK